MHALKTLAKSTRSSRKKKEPHWTPRKVQKVIRKAVSAGDVTVSLEKNNCYKKPSDI